MNTRHATSEDWKTLPFGDCVKIPYAEEFTAEEFALLKSGFIPAQMEDKWFVYFENNSLFLHRSWTGHPIYKIELMAIETGAVVSDAFIEESYFEKGNGAGHASTLNFLVSNLLLGKSVPFPVKANISSEQAAIEQHVVSGTAYKTEIIKPRTLGGNFGKIKPRSQCRYVPCVTLKIPSAKVNPGFYK